MTSELCALRGVSELYGQRAGCDTLAATGRIRLIKLFGEKVFLVELRLHRAKHEVGVVETQMLFDFARSERAAAACPILKRGRGALAREGLYLAIESAADFARVDDDDFALTTRLGIALKMQLEPGILEGGVVRHIGVLFHEFENLLLQRLVFAKGCFCCRYLPR